MDLKNHAFTVYYSGQTQKPGSMAPGIFFLENLLKMGRSIQMLQIKTAKFDICSNQYLKTMKWIIITLFWFGSVPFIYSQSELLWSRNFITEIRNYYLDYPSMQVNGDTIKVIGKNNTPNGQRLLIVSYDLKGDTLSTGIFGKDSVSNNTIIDYRFDSTNHVYILQKEKLTYYKSKIILQKYALDGTLVWVEQIHNPGDTSFTPHSLTLTNDTLLLLTAYKEYDYLEEASDVNTTTTISQLYAYNSKGSQIWHREFNPVTEIGWFIYSMFVHDNIIYLFGDFNKLIKVATDNKLIYTGTTTFLNGLNNIQPTSDGNFLISAWTNYRISKVNHNGSRIWTKSFASYLPSNTVGDEIRAMIQDSAGNIYITGRHYGSNLGSPSHTNADILTLKYDSSGQLLWENRYEFGIDNADIGNTIHLKNGYIYVGGNSERLGVATDYDYIVLKIDAETGTSSGSYRYNGIANGDDAVSSMFVFDNGNVALTGLSLFQNTYNWTTQLLSDIVSSVLDSSKEIEILIYPNPVLDRGILNVKGDGIESYTIYSVIGQEVQKGKFGTSHVNEISLNDISKGIFFIYLRSGNRTITQKLVIR